MMLEGCRVLVTGATGFIGRHTVVAARALGADVHTTSRRGSGAPNAATPVNLLDETAVCDLVARVRPDHVIHLGGAIGAPDVAFAGLLAANAAGTEALLAATSACSGVQSVLIVSSSAVYDASAPLPLTESAPVAPTTQYGLSKAAQELVARSWRRRVDHLVIVARLFNVVGPGQSLDLALSAFARQIARAERGGPGRVEVGRLDAMRDYVDVRDVARALTALVAGPTAQHEYNVASGVGRSVQAGLDVLLHLATQPLEVVTDPARVRSGDIPAQIGDSARLRADTGWEPTVAFEQTMADLLEHWRQKPEAP